MLRGYNDDAKDILGDTTKNEKPHSPLPLRKGFAARSSVVELVQCVVCHQKSLFSL